MKFVGIIFVVAVSTFTVQSSDTEFFGKDNQNQQYDFGKELEKNGMNLVNLFNQTGEKVVDEVKKHTGNFVDELKKGELIKSFKDVGKEFLKNAGVLVDKTYNFMNKTTALQTKALNAANDLLNKTEDEMQKIMSEVNQNVNEMVTKTTTDLMNQLTNLEKWKERVLKPYKGQTQYAETEKVVDDFIKDRKGNINSCVDNVLKPLKELQANVNETAMEAICQARNVVSLAGNCTMLRENTIEHISNCLRGIPISIFDANVFISMRILPIREKLLYYGVNQAMYTTCIFTMTSFINIGEGIKEIQLNWLK